MAGTLHCLACEGVTTLEGEACVELNLASSADGRITMETASQFRSEIETLAPKHKFLEADLGGIHIVDSEGLGSILGTYILALSHGCDLILVNVNSGVQDLLEITRLQAVFGNRT